MDVQTARLHKFSEPLRLETISLPKLKPHEVRIKIKFAGLNFYEISLMSGKYSTIPSLPCTPGGELSGEVIEVGSHVTEFKKKTRVFSLAQTGKGTTGSYATYANVDEKYVYHLPEFLSFQQGASFPMVSFTAYCMLTKKISLKQNDVVLIHSAAGGVGTILTRLIRTLYPHVTILGTYSHSDKEKKLKENGVTKAIESKDDFEQEVKQYTPQGIDVIFDPVGQALFDKHLSLLKPLTGTLCCYGSYTGPIKDTNVVGKIRAKNLKLTGFLMWPLIENKVWSQKVFEKIFRLMKSKAILPPVDRIFPLSHVDEALLWIKERKNKGKILLSCAYS